MLKFSDLQVGERCQGPGTDICEKIVPVRFSGEIKNAKKLSGGLVFINGECEVFRVGSDE